MDHSFPKHFLRWNKFYFFLRITGCWRSWQFLLSTWFWREIQNTSHFFSDPVLEFHLPHFIFTVLPTVASLEPLAGLFLLLFLLPLVKWIRWPPAGRFCQGLLPAGPNPKHRVKVRSLWLSRSCCHVFLIISSNRINRELIVRWLSWNQLYW